MAYGIILAALADPTRREILQQLRSGPQNVASLAQNLPISRPAVSQRLKILSDAGLLQITPKGTSRVYNMAPEGVRELQNYLYELRGGALNTFA